MLNFVVKVIGLWILDLVNGDRRERRAAMRVLQQGLMSIVILVVVVPTFLKLIPFSSILEKQIEAVQLWGSLYGDLLQGRPPRVMDSNSGGPSLTPKY